MNKSKLKNTLVFTVIYPQALRYIDEFFTSVKNQRNKEFDLLIVDDGVLISKDQLKKIELGVNIDIIKGNNNIVENREVAIEYAIINGYENIICFDCDDLYTPNKVEIIVNMLKDCDTAVHDMSIINKDSKIIQDHFIGDFLKHKKTICFEDIIDKNFIGFGNVGFKVHLLKESLPIPKEIIAVDWWLIATLLTRPLLIKYSNQKLSLYRQYDDNMASIQKSDLNTLNKEIDIKIKHYNNLIKFLKMKSRNLKYINYIEDELCFITELQDKLLECNIKKMLNTTKELLWWDLTNNFKGE